jgi:hypothetical protein
MPESNQIFLLSVRVLCFCQMDRRERKRGERKKRGQRREYENIPSVSNTFKAW